tara:strand:+ start:239 stop:1168 length:930 start_codon:yes stop_codon:yes gene_type:complete
LDDNNKSLINEGEIDLLQLITELWNKKALIIFLTTIAAIISVLYSLSLPNIYRSQALLAPADSQSQGMSSGLGGLSSIAGIAGISIPGTGDAKKTEAIAILNSHQFLEEFINSHNLVVPIMASKGWDKESNKLIYNEKLYDAQKNQWLVKDGKDLKPSIQETVKKFRLMVSSSVDKKNGYLLIFADTYSPYISKQWVELLIVDINKYIMKADVERAEKSLEYLNSQINQTAIPELKQVVAQLIKKEQQTIMLSQSSPEYIFKVIDRPIVPELKLSPKRAIICIVGTITGFMIAVALVLALIFRRQVITT